MLDLDFKNPPKTPEDISKLNDCILLIALAMWGADERHSKGEMSDEEYEHLIKTCREFLDSLPKNHIVHPPILPPSLCPGCCGG